MSEDERLIAEQVVPVERARALTVRISQDTAEDFWRVDVSSDDRGPAAASGRHMSTTVAPGDSFMMNLIQGAMSGEQVAWRHLAHWGQDNLSHPARISGPRLG